MNKETHAEFIKLIEQIEKDHECNDNCQIFADKIKEILDYDIKLDMIKSSINDLSLEL